MAGDTKIQVGLLAALSSMGCAGDITDGSLDPEPAPGLLGELVDASDRLHTGQTSTTDVAMLDVDADGDLDLVWASQSFGPLDPETDERPLPGLVEIGLNRGDASFDSADVPDDFGNWTFIAPIDIDGDADPDLVFTRPGRAKTQVAMLRNEGSGRFIAAEFPEVLGNDDGMIYGRAACADIDLDGDEDILLPVFSTQDFERDMPNLLFLNDGTGRFERDTEDRLPRIEANKDWTLSIAVGDFDMDGDPDLIFGEAEMQSRFLGNNGSGFFGDMTDVADAPLSRIPTDMARAYHVLPVDLDVDGDQDLVVVNDTAPSREGGTVAFGNFVLPNNGEGLFDLVPLPAAPEDSKGVAVGDVNGDGFNDIVVGNAYAGGLADHEGEAIVVWLGDGDGGYVESMAGIPRFNAGLFGIAVGDLNGDGAADIAAAVGEGDETGTLDGDFSNILLLSR